MLFNKTTAASFKNKSNQILDVFLKTQKQLEELNNEQGVYLLECQKQIDMLKSERSQIIESIDHNKSIIKKIDAIVS